jgi:hypothetical protein
MEGCRQATSGCCFGYSRLAAGHFGFTPGLHAGPAPPQVARPFPYSAAARLVRPPALFHGTSSATLLLAVAPLASGTDITIGMGTIGVGSLTWTGAEAVVVCGLLAHDLLLSKEPLVWRCRGLRCR